MSPKRGIIRWRACLVFLLTAFPFDVLARPKLGDEEWMRCFRALVKLFNNFVEPLDKSGSVLTEVRLPLKQGSLAGKVPDEPNGVQHHWDKTG